MDSSSSEEDEEYRAPYPKYDEEHPHPRTGERERETYGSGETVLYERQADGSLKIISIKSKLTKSQKNNQRRRKKKQAERYERECQERMDEWDRA